jgi:transposase
MRQAMTVKPRFVGLDLHKNLVVICIIDAGGKVVLRQSCSCTREALEQFGQKQLLKTDKLALEATTNTWQVVELLKPYVAEVVVSNPLKTKAIAEAKIKTDKVDALVLAQLLRCDFLPSVWEPPTDTQQLRRLTARRSALVWDQTAIKNRIHAILHQRLIKSPLKDLFCQQGRQWLRELALDPEGRASLDSDLRLLEYLEEEITKQEKILSELAYRDQQVKLLMTLPGISRTVALTLLGVLGDVARFRDGDHAASYLGLVPSTHQSADHCYHGSITKQGNRRSRTLLVQAAQHLDTHPGPLGAFFRRIAKRKGRNIAVVATARKLAVIAWQMLRDNEPYRYAQPATVQWKMNDLRVKATGERRKPGFPKGTKRAAGCGSGKGTRTIPSLAEVYEQAGLPAPREIDHLPGGELKMLQQTETMTFAHNVRTPQRVVRDTGKPQNVTTETKG